MRLLDPAPLVFSGCISVLMANGVLKASLLYEAKTGDLDKIRTLIKQGKSLVNCSDVVGYTPLHYACRDGHLKVVKALVSEFDADLTKQGYYDLHTPLHCAAENGHLDVVKALVSKFEVDVSIQDDSGSTPLHYACKNNELTLTRVLLMSKSKAHLTVQDNDGCAPLHYACRQGYFKIAKVLLSEDKAALTIQDKSGCTPLHCACGNGHLNIVRLLVSKFKAYLSIRDAVGRTALMFAVKGEHEALVLALLHDYQCPVTDRDNDGWGVLHHACAKGNVSIVQTLIRDYKADINALNNKSETPFAVAFKHENIDVAYCLIREFGCDPNVSNEHRQTPLHCACEQGDINVVQALVHDHKANVNVQSMKGTPLHVAFKAGKYDVVIALLSVSRCDPNVLDAGGQAVLHLACKEGATDIVRALVREDRADVNLYNEQTDTPLHVAFKAGKEEIVLALIGEPSCDVNKVDRDGNTVLHLACESGSLSVVCALAQRKSALSGKQNDSCIRTPSNFHRILESADLSVQNAAGCTPLMLAARGGHEDVVLALLRDYQCPVTDRDNDGWGVLHHACAGGSVGIVQTLVDHHKAISNKQALLFVALNHQKIDVAFCLVSKYGSIPNVKNSEDKSLLHYVCESGDLNRVQTLILHKADVNSYSKRVGTPLHVAFRAGKYEVLLSLMSDPSCDPYMKDQDGQTVLHLACKAGNIDLVNALLHTHKMDVNARNEHKETSLHVATASDQYEVVLALVKRHSCDLNALDQDEQTVLHMASKRGAIEVVRLLMKNMADVNVCANKKHTPLHMAAWGGHYDVVLALVSNASCAVGAKDYLGRTALHNAAIKGHHKIVQMILKFTSPLVVDEFGNTPLHLASHNFHVKTVECLLHDNAPVLVRNAKGYTPRNLARGECGRIIEEYIQVNYRELRSHYSTILKLAQKRYSGSHWITRILVVGNPGAGKSSLIESLKRERFFESFNKVSESTVPPHTAGIIPSVHMSSQCGRILFYDFAGDAEYYSSHAAIFESLASSRKGDNIFIIVVDMREDSDALETTLHYWFSFIRYQQFKEKPYLIVVGSHFDQSVDKSESLDEFCTAIQPNVCDTNLFMLDCRDPRSSQIVQFKRLVLAWVSESQKYELSSEARLLLGLLEKDFSAVTACSVQTLVSHIKDCGGWLPVEPKPLRRILLELHEVGVLLLLGDCTKDTDHVILNISKLTNEVHGLLFSKSAISSIKKKKIRLISAPHCNVGILPEAILDKTLPQHITKECLVHLQYCQQINHSDIGFFPSFAQEDATSQSFLFFPALCSADKSQVSWDESSSNSFSIGWLALCTDVHDYFPPRFLHVLLLRLVHRFTLSVPAQLQTAHASPEHSRRCTMWKRGVYWKMEEGVHCMVELVNGSKGVVVLTKSSMNVAEDCVQVFSDVVSCVMEAKIEFCDSAKPEFYLLDSGADGNYLNGDYLFAVSDVKRALENSQGKHMILSVSGDKEMKLSKLQALRKLTYWNHLFPITGHEVLLILEEVGIKIFKLGLCLGASWAFLESLEADLSSDISQRRIRLVSWWMKSSSTPPCWYTLTEALIDIEMKVLADRVRERHNLHIRLQEKMLSKRTQVKKTEQMPSRKTEAEKTPSRETEAEKTLSRETEAEETEKMLSRETEAEEIEKTPSREIETEKTEKMSRETEPEKPDEEFLHAFSSVVGSRWPTLAVSLALSKKEIKGLKEKVGLSQQELALQMLKIWASKKEGTYGQLYHSLNAILLFQHLS